MKKYTPKTKAELQKLIKNNSINLGDIDVSAITDMSNLFYEDSNGDGINRKDFSGIENWNVSNVTDMSYMFCGCLAFNQSLGNWDVSKVTNMSSMFCGCLAFNQSLENWNVSNVTNMREMFNWCGSFNEPIENWNVSNVTDMREMFSKCEAFNQSLENWNVSNVTNMREMFSKCEAFNQSLENWNVSNVTDMSYMFCVCLAFNQSLGNWDVSNVTDMSYMFCGCLAFNQSLGNWDVSNVTDMSYMFCGCLAFNQSLEDWDVSNVTNMSYMFCGCPAFNQSLEAWDVSNVTNMSYMFCGCPAFNQSLGNWNVLNVTNMREMFSECEAFNQSLENWNVSNVTDMSYMFHGCKSFNQSLENWNVSNVTDTRDMFYGCNCDSNSSRDDKNCVKYYNNDDEEETTYETWLENNKVMVAINGDRFVFCKNGDDVDFEIPSKALKFLCFKLQMHDDIGIYNKKEFYNGGELKSLEFIAENTFSKYEFSKDRKLLSFLTKSDYYEVNIKNIEYFSKDDESFVKGTISGWDYIEDFAQFLCLKDIANLYKSDIDTTALLKNGLEITGVPINMKCIDYINLTYNEYGTLSSIYGSDMNMIVEFDDDGLLLGFVMNTYIGGEETSLDTYVLRMDGARDGYAKIRAFNSNLDGRVLEVLGSEFDENGDVISQGDVIVNKTFYTAFYGITCLNNQDGAIYSKDVMDIEYDIEASGDFDLYYFEGWDGSKEWFLNNAIAQDCCFVKTTEFEVKKEHLNKIYGALVENYIDKDRFQFVRYPMVMF